MSKICMVVMNNFLSDTRVFKEAASLVSDGHRVTVIAMKTPQAAAYEEMAGFSVNRIHLRTRRWPKWLVVQLFKYLEFVVKVLQKAWRYRPDVVHAHDFPALPIAWLAARLTRARLVYDTHEFWLGQGRHFYATRPGKWFVRQVEGALARRAEAVITINPTISEQLSKIHGIPRPVVLMNVQPLGDPPQSDKLRSLLGVDANTRIVIYAASFQPQRGLEQLIESTQYLGEDTLLVLMGPDRMGGRLQNYAREHGRPSAVHFLPPVPQEKVAAYVASADIGVIPSQSTCLNSHYGLGNKIFHYISAGVPIAVSDQPERKRIVQEYGVGTTFNASDPQNIAQKISQVLQDPAMCQQMRQRARQAHQTELNWEKEVQKLHQVYQELGAK
jgi:glycosyltransferase involved in cell wall biosynthesis